MVDLSLLDLSLSILTAWYARDLPTRGSVFTRIRYKEAKFR